MSFFIKADLHLHSSCSDGVLDPAQLCEKAWAQGLTHLALCDHDTLAGLPPMARAVDELNRRQGEKRGPMVLLPCVELSTGPQGRIHLLGYGVDSSCGMLADFLREARQRRKVRFQQMLTRLASLGVMIPSALLPQSKGGPLGRAHIARALQSMGVVHTVKQAFDRYLAEGKPAYVAYERPSAAEGMALLQQAGTVPVLAHPCRLGMEEPALLASIQAMRQDGLQGVEVYHPSASPRQIRMLEAFARKQQLLVTGGSDFHGDPGSGDAPGKLPPGWGMQKQDVEALLHCMDRVKPM